jgi:hypothetical protein
MMKGVLVPLRAPRAAPLLRASPWAALQAQRVQAQRANLRRVAVLRPRTAWSPVTVNASGAVPADGAGRTSVPITRGGVYHTDCGHWKVRVRFPGDAMVYLKTWSSEDHAKRVVDAARAALHLPLWHGTDVAAAFPQLDTTGEPPASREALQARLRDAKVLDGAVSPAVPTGVYEKRKGRWETRVYVRSAPVSLGVYDNEAQAKSVVDSARAVMHMPLLHDTDVAAAFPQLKTDGEPPSDGNALQQRLRACGVPGTSAVAGPRGPGGGIREAMPGRWETYCYVGRKQVALKTHDKPRAKRVADAARAALGQPLFHGTDLGPELLRALTAGGLPATREALKERLHACGIL